MNWLASELSVRGKGHEKTGAPCQDSSRSASCHNGLWLVGAVADGGGSLSHSDVGATIATDYTVATTMDFVEGLDLGSMSLEEFREATKVHWLQTAAQIRELIRREAEIEGTDFRQYGSTLLAFIAGPNRFAAFQIGDGFIVTSQGPDLERSFALVFPAVATEHVGEVTWLTSNAWQAEARTVAISEQVDFICASSDGLERVAIVQRTQKPFDNFFNPLREQASGTDSPEGLSEVIRSLITMPTLDRFTDDDKTMLLGLNKA